MTTLPRKLRQLRVAASWYLELLKGHETRRCRPVAHALPDDCTYLHAAVTGYGELMLLITSESFKALDETELVPEHPVTQMEVVTYATDLREAPGPRPDVDGLSSRSTISTRRSISSSRTMSIRRWCGSCGRTPNGCAPCYGCSET